MFVIISTVAEHAATSKGVRQVLTDGGMQLRGWLSGAEA